MGLFQGMFGKVAPGMCRLSPDGSIAVKTSGGYKSYSVKTGRLTNCDNFVFNIGEEFFFLIPTSKVKPGDIILASGRPKCVVSAEKERITAINYEDSTIEQIVPERHVFMGSTYFYGKIVSMFGRMDGSGKKGGSRILKYLMLSEIFKGGQQPSEVSGKGVQPSGFMGSGTAPAMMAMLMLGGKEEDVFADLFSFGDDMEDPEGGEEE